MTKTAAHSLLQKFDRPVPRYTSYPTAPNFLHVVTQGEYRELLRALPADQAASLYIHIPFCRHLCFYCGCNTKIVDHDAPIHDYLQTLMREAELAAEAIGRKKKVSHIHFGGGTPNFASTEDLAALFEKMGECFSLAPDLAVAMEMDPRLLSRQRAQDLAGLGVNRVSFGVQDFQPEVQKAINRIQPFEQVKECVDWLRDAGIQSVNFDMIYGLPLQTPGGMRDNMQKLAALSPDRVALFGYAHVPWFKEHQKKLESYPLPDTFARFAMAESAREDLIEAGYVPIGIDHFAKPGDELAVAFSQKRLRRNFQGYTTDGEDILIALGQTSISNLGRAYVQNTDRNRDYRDRVAAGEFPVVKGCILSDEDVYRRALIEQLMCYGSADLRSIKGSAPWAETVWQSALPQLEALRADGLVLMGEMTLTITETGRPFTRIVASSFDAYLQATAGIRKHAKAV